MHQEGQVGTSMSPQMVLGHYAMLGVNLALSLAIMYFAMFTMIWSWGDFVQNINFLYMALIMWAPMGLVMILTMGMMYTDKRVNLILYAGLALVFLLSFWAIRDQALVGDRQFLRSMIPHHSGAILMCREASIRDPEIVELCGEIIESQQREIDQMKAIRDRL